MPRKSKQFGKGAIGKCLGRRIHPHEHVRRVFPDLDDRKDLTGLFVLRLENRIFGKVETECVIFYSEDVKDDNDDYVELYVAKRYFRISSEGSEDDFFMADQENRKVVAVKVEEKHENLPQIPDEIYQLMKETIIDDNIIDQVRLVMRVDDDNNPIPENIPATKDDGDDKDDDDCYYNHDWGFSGICPRRMNNIANSLPVVKGSIKKSPDLDILFELFFPKTFIVEVMIPKMNSKLRCGKLSYGEFLRFLGLWLVMGTVHNKSRQAFWQTNDVSIFHGVPFRLHKYMSGKRFEDIFSALTYTNQDPPETNTDEFFPVRQLVDAWNANMTNSFSPGWITCVGKSLMVWTNKYLCPGLMCMPDKKPYPFGNGWHSICCAQSGILFQLAIDESTDAPKEEIASENSEDDDDAPGDTASLLLRLTKGIWYSGKVLILNSKYSVLKALIELKKKGLYASAPIQQQQYWPKFMNGEVVDEHFVDKDVGYVDAIGGTKDSQAFHIFGLKLPSFTMKMVSTYGIIDRVGPQQNIEIDGRRVTFQRPEVIANHYAYNHFVDEHDTLRRTSPQLDVMWEMASWPNRVFAFMLAVTEINMMLATRFFYEDKTISKVEFRKKLSEKLINNKYVDHVQETGSVDLKEIQRTTRHGRMRRIKRQAKHNSDCAKEHELLSLPSNKKFRKGQMVDAVSKYPQHRCSTPGCTKEIRTYCKCMLGVYMCKGCFTKHVVEINGDFEVTTKHEEDDDDDNPEAKYA